MLVYDISGENFKKEHHKKIKSDLISLILKCGGCPVTFSDDNKVYVYDVPKEGPVVFHEYKNFVRVFLGFSEESKTLNYFLAELDKIRRNYQ